MTLPTQKGAGATPPGEQKAVLTLVAGGLDERAPDLADGGVANESAGGLDPADLAGTLRHQLDVQDNLCTALETLADGLPADVRNEDCLALARSVCAVVRRSHAFEERELFPFLQAKSLTAQLDAATFDRLRGEHLEDEAFAEEVHNELVAFAADREAVNVDKLGYMLRGFFVGVRRHLAFEREQILPMIENVERN